MNKILIALSIFTFLNLISYFLFSGTKKTIVIIGRIFLGLIFLFSGFVKLIDPLGTNYKFIDYFESFGFQHFVSFALPLAMIMCVAEFLIGAGLFFSTKIKLSAWAVLLFMLFFTPLTLFLALKNPVPDCGCFGDAVKLTNWQTFWKNIIIDVFVVIVFISRNRIKFGFKEHFQTFIVVVAALFGFGMTIHCYRHLPVIDFLNWKKGTMLVPENPKPLEYFVSYKNKKTGEKKEFLSKNIPTDSVFANNWSWDSTRISDPNEIKYNGPSIADEHGNVVTDNFVKNPDYQFILVAYDLTKTNISHFKKILDLFTMAQTKGYSFVTLTSSSPEQVKIFKTTNHFDSEFYYADDTSLKAIIRANPGLILLKKGKVIDKWHFNDIPTFELLKNQYLK